MARIADAWHDRPERNVHEPVLALGPRGRRQSAAHIGTLVDLELEEAVDSVVREDDIGDLADHMPHVVATERTLRATEELR